MLQLLPFFVCLFVRLFFFSYLTRHQTCCHSRSQWGWGPSSHGWTRPSCGEISHLRARPTAEWLALETKAPLGPSPHLSRRWGSNPSGGGPGQDSRERQRDAAGEFAHKLPTQRGWSYPLRVRGENGERKKKIRETLMQRTTQRKCRKNKTTAQASICEKRMHTRQIYKTNPTITRREAH